MENTRDLSKFGEREMEQARALLNALCDKNETEYLDGGVSIEFNPSSGKVFLVDNDYNVGVVENGALVDFVSCGNCDYEGTAEEYKLDKTHGNTNECCKERFES